MNNVYNKKILLFSGYNSMVEWLYVAQFVPCSNQGIHPYYIKNIKIICFYTFSTFSFAKYIYICFSEGTEVGLLDKLYLYISYFIIYVI